MSVKSKLSSQNISSAPKAPGVPNIDIGKDNIYLKGGSNLAEAIMGQ